MIVAEAFNGSWVELAMIGFATTIVTNALLAYAQSPERCAPALTRDRRAALLLATCDASESGWARVIRAELADDTSPQAPSGGAYRDAPSRRPSDSAARVYAAERARIQRTAAIGLAGTAASIAGAAVVLPAQPVLMSIIAIVALVVGWRFVRNVRAALAALGSALDAVPLFGAELRARPEDRRLAEDVPWTQVNAPSVLGFALLGIAAIVTASVVASAARPMSAREIGLVVGGQLFCVPLILAGVTLVRSASVSIDGARRELRVVREILGLPYARTSVPLEIVAGVSVEKKKAGRSTDTFVVVSTAEGAFDLAQGEGAAAAVAAITSRFRAP